jgi:RHS repeat-associated protein
VYFGGRLIQAAGTVVVVDRLGSNVTGGKRYFPYGQEKPSAPANNVEKFTGYFRDAETGLEYADQRYHEPGKGRFTTPDPIGSGLNHYAYVGGDPINFTDPTGMERCQIFGDDYVWCIEDPPAFDLFGSLREPLQQEQHLKQCPDGFLVFDKSYCGPYDFQRGGPACYVGTQFLGVGGGNNPTICETGGGYNPGPQPTVLVPNIFVVAIADCYTTNPFAFKPWYATSITSQRCWISRVISSSFLERP